MHVPDRTISKPILMKIHLYGSQNIRCNLQRLDGSTGPEAKTLPIVAGGVRNDGEEAG